MTTTASTLITPATTPAAAPAERRVPGVTSSAHRPAAQASFLRLLGVEFRKLVDTRAGKWLLAVGVVLAVGMTLIATVLMGYIVRPGGSTPGAGLKLVSSSTAGGSMLATFVAILGILSICGEWGQRTTLTTFALEPRRGRVLLAKLLVIVAVSTAMWALSYPMAALGQALAAAWFHVPVSYSLTAAAVAGSYASMLLGGALLGAGLGVLLQNSAAAIVAFLVLPMLLKATLLIELAWKPFGKAVKWIDPSTAQDPFLAGTWHLTDLGPLAVTTAIWIVLPLAIGTWRWIRRECK